MAYSGPSQSVLKIWTWPTTLPSSAITIRLQRQKNCKTSSFQGMLHKAAFHATSVAAKLQDKSQ